MAKKMSSLASLVRFFEYIKQQKFGKLSKRAKNAKKVGKQFIGGTYMLSVVEERQMKIVNHLKATQFTTVSELVNLLNYSEATIKRDLVQLENQGLIRRTRGGAMSIDNTKIDVPYMMKITNYDSEKNKEYMASIAQTMIKDDMTLFLDSSTTSLHLVSTLTKFNGLQVITNGVMTASVLSQYTNASVSILGGLLVPSRFTVNGSI